MRLVIALTLLVTLAADAAAQNRGNTGGGGSLFGSGQSLFGGGGSGIGGGGIGGGFGSGGFGGSGFGGQSGFGGGGTGGFGNQGITQPQQGGPVGRSADSTNALFEALNQSGNQFLDRIERTFGSRNRGRGINQADAGRPPIRVRLRLGFDAPPSASPINAEPAVARLNTLLAEKGFADASVYLDGGATVITGVVQDAADRRMLARLAQLEPGVGRVDNRLRLVGEATESVLPPPAD